MPDESPGQAEPMLDVAEAAARAGIQPSSWRSAVSRGYLPPPDDPDASAPKTRRRPRWRVSTVDGFIGSRPGRGHRTDLTEARKESGRRVAAELAEAPPVIAVAVQEWLQANHRALLAVADALVDHREALLASVDAGRRDDLADAIDRAGEEMSGRPSRLLASAVTYAQFLLRADGLARLPAEVREGLTLHAHLHDEFNHLRGQGGMQ